MAAFTGKAAGNWTAGGQTTWNEDLGGGHDTPVAGDTVDLNGKVIVMDVAALPVGGGTLTSLASTGAGQLTVDLSVLGDSSLNATAINGGTNTGGTILVSGAAPAATLTVTGNIKAVSGTNGAEAIRNASTGTLAIIGNVQGGDNSITDGAINSSTGTITVVGNVIGGTAANSSGSGLVNSSTGAVNVTGNVTGGNGSNWGASGGRSYGIQNSSSGTATVDGNVTGGSFNGSYGIVAKHTGVVTLNNCQIINTAACVAYVGKPPVWVTDGTNYAQWLAGADGLTETKFAPEPNDGKIIEGTTVGTVAGAYHEATVAEVEDGVMFGDASALEGTFAGGVAVGVWDQPWR